jgi:hypothetical protein
VVFQEHETEGSWDEYRQLVLRSLESISKDMSSLDKRIKYLEKYTDIHDDFRKLKDDFEVFLINYQKTLTTQAIQINPIASRQKAIFTIVGIILGALSHELFTLWVNSL